MQIDWLTLAAQIVNFLVLVWLLQRFLYRPITRVMERRERRIRERLDEAARTKSEAEDERRAYREKIAELEQQRDRMLTEAREAAEKERKSLEAKAREAIESRKQRWLHELETQRHTFLRDVRRRSTEQFYALARRALGDLAGAGLEEQLALRFLKELEILDKDAREKMTKGCAEAGGRIELRSRFAFSPSVKGQVMEAVHGLFGNDARVEYRTTEDIACGMELKAGSQRIAWSLDSYLDDFEKAVGDQVSSVSIGSPPRTDA
jgi:F-type H+-transporting ATPase subunit b